jgi:hypothetical protein
MGFLGYSNGASTSTIPTGLKTFDSYQVVETIGAPTESKTKTILGEPMNIGTLPKERFQQLHYVQQLDMAEDAKDNQDQAWQPVAILKHKIRKINPEDVHMKLKVQWPNGETSWQRAEPLRLQDPYIVAEYVCARGLIAQPEFEWIKSYLSDDEAMRAMVVKAKPHGNTAKYKFGVQVPHGTRHALLLDKLAQNKEWQSAIATELKQINEYKTFRSVSSKDDMSTYQKIPYHIVYDVKFDLRKKARLVANGNHASPTKDDIYSGVVAMDTIRLAFQLAAMNGLSC